MSEQNVEIVRRMLAAWRSGDNEAALALFAPDAVIDMTVRPDGQLYRGPQGMEDAMRVWIQSWDDYRMDIEDNIDVGDYRVVTLWREQGRGKGSAVKVELVGATIWSVKNGLVTHAKPYIERQAALEAAGLAEPRV